MNDVLQHEVKYCYNTLIWLLGIFLFCITILNLETTQVYEINSVVAQILSALTMANATTSPKPRRPSRSASVRSSGGSGTQLKNIEDMEKCDFDFNDKYFAFLETMVAWGIEDENDEIADNVVKNVNHNAEE